MAFTSNREYKSVFGNKQIAQGSFENEDGTTLGTLRTGLNSVGMVIFTLDSDSTDSTVPTVEGLPQSSPDVDVTTLGELKGKWIAFSR